MEGSLLDVDGGVYQMWRSEIDVIAMKNGYKLNLDPARDRDEGGAVDREGRPEVVSHRIL
ncbi:predicted protein [Sclerotinia sclerotiorum 1980 UF-70]|uniref:Uncharacterized protein n=1 Tax=Sclerotinia sclerotiorum (strain ATCC 18683 / 1980 / Ss-1) TaxID=665079 RepID=A7E644_SCLS1|nr:predicted protein [Sclerotinia sclerotiorum 1980 UF-70]EDN91366.1 predicted protein [Sclerotinia sclerotiorum 1980 UF-70]